MLVLIPVFVPVLFSMKVKYTGRLFFLKPDQKLHNVMQQESFQ